jgi:hypothetical protein
MILIIIFTLILAIFFWIAFAPLNIIVNTVQNRYQVSQVGTVTISWHPNERAYFKIRVFGLNVNTHPKETSAKSSVKPTKKGRTQTGKSLNAWIFLLKGIFRSFTVRRFEGTIDFDDVVLNAQLYPVFHFANGGATRISTNFRGEYYLDILVQGRIYRMLWTVIQFYLTKK